MSESVNAYRVLNPFTGNEWAVEATSPREAYDDVRANYGEVHLVVDMEPKSDRYWEFHPTLGRVICDEVEYDKEVPMDVRYSIQDGEPVTDEEAELDAVTEELGRYAGLHDTLIHVYEENREMLAGATDPAQRAVYADRLACLDYVRERWQAWLGGEAWNGVEADKTRAMTDMLAYKARKHEWDKIAVKAWQEVLAPSAPKEEWDLIEETIDCDRCERRIDEGIVFVAWDECTVCAGCFRDWKAGEEFDQSPEVVAPEPEQASDYYHYNYTTPEPHDCSGAQYTTLRCDRGHQWTLMDLVANVREGNAFRCPQTVPCRVHAVCEGHTCQTQVTLIHKSLGG